MANSDLAKRAKDFFARQIAFYEKLLARYGSIAQDIQGEDLTGLLEQQRLDETGFSAFAQEFDALSSEYEAATGLSDADRTAIRGLAERARQLALQLRDVSEAANRTLGERMADTRDALDELARGREMLERYRPFQKDRNGGAFVDKRA